MKEPFVESPARLGWTRRFGHLVFRSDVPSVSFALTPVFPGCGDRLAERCIVWDLWRLMDGARRPGAWSILNCECAVPDDAGLEERVCVSHPNHDTVVWELDLAGLAPAIDDAFGHQEGFMRLVFNRAEYEADVRAMLHEVRNTANAHVPFADLSGLRCYADLEKEYPGCRHAVADLFEPTVNGDCDAEEFLELDAEVAWPREPLFPPGTVFEIGLFGRDLIRIDGRPTHDWIGRLFTRWEAMAAFRDWGNGFARRFALGSAGVDRAGDPNEFVLVPGYDLETCHRSGEAFAETLHWCLSEGKTAPGVQVRYVRCNLPADDRRSIAG